jgi:hypothetical protein
VARACEITSWMQLLALSDHQARRWEPKRLRLRLFSIAGHLATTALRRALHLSTNAPWTQLALHALSTLRALTGRPGPQRIIPRHTVPTTQTPPRGVELRATQATLGDPSHPHSIITTETGQPRTNRDPDQRRETSRLTCAKTTMTGSNP